MHTLKSRSVRAAVAALLLLMPTGLALAGSGEAWPASQQMFSIGIETGAGSGSYELVFPVTQIEGSLSYTEPNDVTIYAEDGTTQLATLTDLNLVFQADPAVDLNFSIVAGPYGSVVTVTSGTIAFAPIVNPDAYATAAVTLTDSAPANGAQLTGLFAGAANKAYEARYNYDPSTGKGYPWADLLSPLATFGGTIGADDRRPTYPPLYEDNIAPMIDRIESEFYFYLTAGDQASGTSRFEIVPEPDTLSLLALGLGMVIRRRRF